MISSISQFTGWMIHIEEDNLAAYFPEANILIPYDQFAEKSNTPIKPITIPTNNKLKKGWILNLEDAITIRITTKINYIKINMLTFAISLNP